VHEVIYKISDSFCLKSAEKSFKTRICVAVKLDDVTRFSLPFDASWCVGLSEAGQAHVCEPYPGRDVLALQLSGTGGQWTQLWRRDRPSDIGIVASAPDTSTAFCLMQDCRDAPTVAVAGNGEVSRTEREGELITCLASNRAVYVRRWMYGRGCEIVIWSGADCVTLRPPADQQWRKFLSVCGDGARLAVVDGGPNTYGSPSTLDIFLEHQRK
jgi:hypothetical protein